MDSTTGTKFQTPAAGTKPAKPQLGVESPLVKVVVKVGSVAIERAISEEQVRSLGIPVLINTLKFGEAA